MADAIAESSVQSRPAAAIPANAIAAILDGPPVAEAAAGRRMPWRLLAILAAAGGLAAATPAILARFDSGAARDPFANHPSHTVARQDLTISVTETATLSSDENVDIRCEVRGGSTVIELVADGSQVKVGDTIVVLDSAKISEDLTAQKIALEKARAAQIQAEKDHAAAVIAVEEYAEGTFRKEQHKLRSDLTGARERLQANRNLVTHFEKMFRKGYITPQELEKHKSAAERAKLDEDTATIALDVLERFTKPKMMTELESKRDANAAKKESETAALTLETLKLERLEQQLAKCRITAPKDGVVIYPPTPRWDRDGGIKIGAKVNEAQTILQLPDLSTMRADVGVHESRVEKIRPGMRARIDVQGNQFTGSVTKVATRPNSTGYMDTAKRYEVRVKIDDQSPLLRPGLTAEVEIMVAALEAVIAVPVAAVAEQRGSHVCAVQKAGGVERRTVKLGEASEAFVEITSGLEPGEVVLLNPRAVLGDALPEGDGNPTSDHHGDGGANPGLRTPAAARS
jgi:RND family efflux transporter MFP subunit